MSEAEERLNRNPETKAQIEEALQNLDQAIELEIKDVIWSPGALKRAAKHLGEGWGFHACGKYSFDPVCQEYGADRLHFNTPLGNITVGLNRDSWSQMWLPWKAKSKLAARFPDKFPDGKVNYRDWFSPIVYTPPRRLERKWRDLTPSVKRTGNGEKPNGSD